MKPKSLQQRLQEDYTEQGQLPVIENPINPQLPPLTPKIKENWDKLYEPQTESVVDRFIRLKNQLSKIRQ